MEELDYTTLTVEKEYTLNFGEQQKKFCFSLNYNEVNSYIFDKSSKQKILKQMHFHYV